MALRRDVVGVVLAGAGVLGFVALWGAQASPLLGGVAHAARALLGLGAPLLPAALVVWGLWTVLGRGGQPDPWRLVGAALALGVLSGELALGEPVGQGFALGMRGHGGGLIGATVDWVLLGLLGALGARVALGTAAVGALLLMVQFPLAPVLLWPWRALGRLFVWLYGFITEPAPDEPAAPRKRTAAPVPAAPPALAAPVPPALLPEPHPQPEAPTEGEPAGSPVPWPEPKSAIHSPPRAVPLAPGVLYQHPPLDLLPRSRARGGRGIVPDSAQRGAQLEEALRSFGVAAKVVAVTQGPAVTRFEVQPGPGVKVSRISALAPDLALTMRAVDVRVAPVPGKAALGIEVPNTDVTAVHLRDVLEGPEFQRASSPLTVCLGQDIAGKAVVASMEQLLHVLVAGATGSGKSITINSMLISMLFKARPDQLRLVLIDPKMVELFVYNGIPHLLAPVVTDPRKAAATLRVVVKDMERRYALFTKAGVRDIGRYNEVAPGRGEEPLPFTVVVIDELADLMLVARADVEDAIQRLTQMARAAGIHLIVATQRPSVDVITGVIKANIPTRIALAVSSQVDSRTILDASGAEKLIGRGDMLFRPVGAQKSVRAQGAYVSDVEVEAVLKFLRENGTPEYDTAMVEADAEGGEESEQGEDGDALFVDALQVVVESHQASVSNLQRRLRVGFTRAGRLIDMMEQRGYVGPHQGSKSREVLLSMDQFRRLYREHTPAE